MLTIVVPIGIKSEPENEFESLGSQKADFYVLDKRSIFQRKMVHPLKLTIQVPISQFFILLGIGYEFLTIFG